MHAFICTTCGAQFPAADAPPARCVICEDERQYVPLSGQGWTTLDRPALVHRNAWHESEPGILGIGIEPRFAIGQRALLLRTAAGNVLCDCIALLDPATVTLIRALGGLQAMAISHPHFYTTMVEWGRAFDMAVHVHAADWQWIMQPDPVIRQWEGERGRAAAGRHADPWRRPLRGLEPAALGRGRGRPRRPMLGRHSDGGQRPEVTCLHAQLSKLHPVGARRGRGDRRSAGSVRV